MLAAGLGGTANWWNANIPTLARQFTVLAFDQRGTGRSSRIAVHSVEQMSADLIAVLDAANLDRVAFLGHSTGGAIGVATALDCPGRLPGLVIYASTTCGNSYRRRISTSVRIFSLTSDPSATRGIRLCCCIRLTGSTPTRSVWQKWKLRQQASSVIPSYRAAQLGAILRFDRREELCNLHLPTMVLCCEDDSLTSAYFSREYARLIPHARLLLVPRAATPLCADRTGRIQRNRTAVFMN